MRKPALDPHARQVKACELVSRWMSYVTWRRLSKSITFSKYLQAADAEAQRKKDINPIFSSLRPLRLGVIKIQEILYKYHLTRLKISYYNEYTLNELEVI